MDNTSDVKDHAPGDAFSVEGSLTEHMLGAHWLCRGGSAGVPNPDGATPGTGPIIINSAPRSMGNAQLPGRARSQPRDDGGLLLHQLGGWATPVASPSQNVGLGPRPRSPRRTPGPGGVIDTRGFAAPFGTSFTRRTVNTHAGIAHARVPYSARRGCPKRSGRVG